MFATATKKFAKEVDHGLLIPVSSLNDTIDLLTMVVIKRRPLWQEPKYFPTDFHLDGLLTGDTFISPDTKESDFILDFQGTHHDSVDGSTRASYRNIKVGAKGENKSTLQSTFGRLKKEKANVDKLLKDSKNRVLDMSHCLIRQTKKKKKQQFGIVVERIRTTTPCSLTKERQKTGLFEGKVSIHDPLASEAAAIGSGSVSRQSNVTMEIPINTTIAYSLMILEVEQDGSFVLSPFCYVERSPLGGLLSDSDASSLQEGLEDLHVDDHFQLLSSLPVATKSSLLQHLTTIMEDQKAISALDDALELMRQDETLDLPDVTITESQNQNIQAILELVEQSDQSTSVNKALNPIISALEELPSSCLDVLRTCCSPTVLQTLEKLLLVQTIPLTALTGDVYEKAEQMFTSCNVSLKRDGDTVKTKMQQESEDLPLMLCIAIRGLASLGP